nr:MAG TPA_asm: hypothetical protein [Caudoviricetes sp.]
MLSTFSITESFSLLKTSIRQISLRYICYM